MPIISVAVLNDKLFVEVRELESPTPGPPDQYSKPTELHLGKESCYDIEGFGFTFFL